MVKKLEKRIEARVIVKLLRQEHGIALIVVMQFVLLKNVILIICSTITISFHLMEVKLKANVSRYASGLRGRWTVLGRPVPSLGPLIRIKNSNGISSWHFHNLDFQLGTSKLEVPSLMVILYGQNLNILRS